MKKEFGPFLRNEGDSSELSFMEGATIEAVGMTSTGRYSDGSQRQLEGGLTFMINKNGKRERVILSYTELGLWLEHRSEVK